MRQGRVCGWMLLALGMVALFAGCGQQAPVAERLPAAVGEARSGARAAGGERYDLQADEEQGGHTLRKHVGRSDEELEARLRRERGISAASTWTDVATAEETVAQALRSEGRRVEAWKGRGYPRANLALHYDAGREIGRSMRRGEGRSVACTQAVVVLRATGPESFIVLTTYPEARE